jgi:HK97 gp10 family phage protein
MARFDLSLLGDSALAARLAALPEKTERKVLRQAMRRAGQPILQAARSNANRRSGRMARSIKLRALRRRKGRIGVAIQTGTRLELGIGADDQYYYPAIVEFGDGETHRPYRFMRRALDANRATSMQRLRVEIGQGIEREAATTTL